MDRLFSPWRSKYIESFKGATDKNDGCIFCNALEDDDEKHLIVHRGNEAFVIMNLYPYNSGHLMIVPKRHTAEFLSLSESEMRECMKLLQLSQQTLHELSAPHGYNIGMNLGRSAGAGIEDHLHWHIVPRWSGDTNFMPTLADIKVVSEDMQVQHRKLTNLFREILGS